jgi:tetratricopeptide (TPR) repeat protein
VKAGLVLFFVICLFTFPVLADDEHHHGPETGEKLGTVHFPISCSPEAQQQFDLAVAMLHSFWYEEAEKTFTVVTVTDPACAMGYWGIAMSLYHPLWATPPSPDELKRGSAAIQKARTLEIKTDREKDYIAAIESYYKDYDKLDHATRKQAFEKSMEQVHLKNPEDKEAAVFYALSLVSISSPKDKTYANQKKALDILNQVLAEEPQHPGVAHYIIHSTDYPALAPMGLNAARSYAKIAPSVPHALHMPSHIFTRLGLWQESIQSNTAAANAAKQYSQQNFPGKVWDQQLHAMDYMMYAYLQIGQDAQAKAILDEVNAMQKAQPESNTSGYAFAAIPARYAIERGQWADAARLEIHPADFPWSNFAWSESITFFATGLGGARSGNLAIAHKSLDKLAELRDAVRSAKNDYAADQIEIERLAVAGWTAHAEKKDEDAEKLLRASAEMEDSTDKDNVTPGSILPAREQLGVLLLELKRPQEALVEFEASMTITPNRLNGVYGAARAAEQAGDRAKAQKYYANVMDLCQESDGNRPAVQQAKRFLATK